MAEQNSQDRNLPASKRKLDRAREEGQTVSSRDLGHFIAIAVGGALLGTVAPLASGWMTELLLQGLRFDAAMVHNPAAMTEQLFGLTLRMLAVVLPFGAVMMAVGVAGSVAIGGFNWTLKPLMPKFEPLNPITGLPKLLSKDKLIDALKGSALALILGTIGGYYLKGHIESFTEVLAMPLPAALQSTGHVIVGGMLLLLLALAAFALVDVPLQRHLHAQRQKMSRQEQKQEHKEVEGSGEVKAKMKARMREMGRRRMMAAVPTADLVVMNPTHYAVALKYEEGVMGAPRVVAKGADLIAMAIRDIAKNAQVPVLQSPVLARALYAHAEIDREIPAALFGAVAQVLAYVYQLRAALGGRGAWPNALPELNVPPELDPHHKPLDDIDAGTD